MAIAYVNDATDSVAGGADVTLPTGSATEALVLLWSNKPYDATPDTPSGFTSRGTITNGTTASGADSGSVRCTAFTKVSDGTESSFTSTFTGAVNVWLTRGVRFSKSGSDTWQFVATTGADSDESNTSVSVTGADTLDIAAGDFVVFGVPRKTDSGALSSESLAIAGCTGTLTKLNTAGSTTSANNDLGMDAYRFEVTSGTASGPPVFTATHASTAGSATAIVFIRLRAANNNQTISGDIATETDTALAGSVILGAVTIMGGLATETDSALTGSVTTGQIISGGIATETDTALAGSVVVGGVTIMGGIATETDTALGGTVSAPQVIVGGIATEVDTALGGTVIAPQIIVGGIATETDSALTGSVLVIFTTDTETTNSANGRDRTGYFELIVEYATAATPAGQEPIRTMAQSVPPQDMEDGRPV